MATISDSFPSPDFLREQVEELPDAEFAAAAQSILHDSGEIPTTRNAVIDAVIGAYNTARQTGSAAEVERIADAVETARQAAAIDQFPTTRELRQALQVLSNDELGKTAMYMRAYGYDTPTAWDNPSASSTIRDEAINGITESYRGTRQPPAIDAQSIDTPASLVRALREAVRHGAAPEAEAAEPRSLDVGTSAMVRGEVSREAALAAIGVSVNR